MDFETRVGMRIRELRMQAGFSQAQLAERIGPNVAVGTVSRWERGTRTPTFQVLNGIATALGTDFDTFLGGIVGRPAPRRSDHAEVHRIVTLVSALTPDDLRRVAALVALFVDSVADRPPADAPPLRRNRGKK